MKFNGTGVINLIALLSDQFYALLLTIYLFARTRECNEMFIRFLEERILLRCFSSFITHVNVVNISTATIK